MSLLVKSGWGRGKRVKKGEGNTFISTGYWVLVMTIDYSHHRAVTASQHWLNGYESEQIPGKSEGPRSLACCS